MATFKLRSRLHGYQIFTVPDDGGYVRRNGTQICTGGKFLGSTITANEKSLETTARKWWADFLKNQRSY